MNKRKILESARKLAQKGSKDKALAEYQKLLKLDPKDAKLRLEIGDAHRRWGQVEQAVETYTRVAEQYMAEGFDARAVAVFKQILNLAPDRFEAYTPLAELYERMGLVAEAIGALQTAADGLHRQGRKGDALEVLRRMANADPGNTTSRIKVADLLRQEGRREDAVHEYLLAAEELERQGDVEAIGNLYRRILEIDESHVVALGALARNLAGRNKVAEAIALAERALQLDDGNVERYEQLAELFARAQRPSDQEAVMRRLAELYRTRGDEARARTIVERFTVSRDLSDTDVDHPDELAGPGLLDDTGDGLFGDEFPDSEGAPEIAADFGSEIGIDPGAAPPGASLPLLDPVGSPDDSGAPLVFDDEDLGGEDERLLEEAPAPARSGAAPGAVDADQLLAEASVYLRYGKRDKAITHLERVIAALPEHRPALEKLGEAFAEDGQYARAVQVWMRAAMCAHESGDRDALRVLRGRIAVLDEAAAAGIGTALGEDAAPVAGLSSASGPGIGLAGDRAAEDVLLIDDDLLDEDIDIEAADEAAGPAASGSGALASAAAAASGNGASLSASARKKVVDDLEEADFYMQQGLHDEAEGIYRRVLAIAPNHPRALLRLGEIEAARGGSGLLEPVGDADETPVPDVDLDLEDAAITRPEVPDDGEAEIEIPIDLDDEHPKPGDDPLATDGELGDLSDLGLDDETYRGEGEVDEETIDASDTQELRLRDPAAGAPDDSFDLAAALADAFDDTGDAAAPAAAGDDGFEAVFAAFKKGVRETLSDGDHQAHYDLAIAYKEMGLLDDAINELRTAMADPGRTAECLHLIGLCAIDADQAPLAIEHLEQLLTMSDLGRDARLAVRFDLGRALEQVGDADGARREWEAVAASRPGFQGVEGRLAGLGQAKPEPEAAVAFESFDDVWTGVEDEEPEREPELVIGGETFDDLLAEANAEDGDPGEDAPFAPEAEPTPAGPPAPASGPAPATRPQDRDRKRKKISFF